MCCVLLGQVIAAAQYVVEEKVLTDDQAAPMALVGLEGIWGALFMIPVLKICEILPGDDVGGVVENTTDSWYRYEHSWWLSGITVVFLVSVLFYNVVGVTVTAVSSAIHHTFLDALRTLAIWCLSLVMFAVSDGHYGEALTSLWWLQICGFMLLVCGQMVYDEVLRIPGLKSNRAYDQSKIASSPVAISSPKARMHSPVLQNADDAFKTLLP